MSTPPTTLRFAKSHEWARMEDDGTVTVGISDHAQKALGDIVFIELPASGTSVAAGDEVAVVESVKAASDVYTPVSGEIISVNEALLDAPETVNGQPYEDGWFFRIAPSDASELTALMNYSDYQASNVDD